MENASKALLIAGGIFISIIVISIFIFGYSHITQLAQSEVDAEVRKEVERFNKPYLAFNKKAMYGTDVISALNMAISNNKVNNVNPDDEFYVNVAFELTEDINNVIQRFEWDKKFNTYKKSVNKTPTFYTEGVYELKSNANKIEEFLKTANDEEEQKEVLSKEGTVETEYKITYSGIADFKRKTFKCLEVNYDTDGRVKELIFKQIQPSKYK